MKKLKIFKLLTVLLFLFFAINSILFAKEKAKSIKKETSKEKLKISSDFVEKTVYRYRVDKEDGIKTEVTLVVEDTKNLKTLTWVDEENVAQIIKVSKKDGNLVSSHYVFPDKKRIDVSYDYKKQKVLVVGKKKKEFKFPKKTYTSEVLFYFFLLPSAKIKVGESTKFDLIQSVRLEVNKMKFTYLKNEKLKIKGKEIVTKKYEMQVNSFVKKLFWPYKYHFWYDAKSGIIVKYEGAEPDKKNKLIELIP